MKMPTKTKRTVICGLCIALCYVLPVAFHAIGLGGALSPMHIPVLLCGLVCGGGYGALCGLLGPILSSLISSMPPALMLVRMIPELCTYGLVAGLLYALRRKPSISYTYLCLISAMLAGRAVWGVTKAALLGLGGKAFTVSAFFIGGFADALPGIILQLLLIPVTVKLLERLTDRSTT